MSTLVIRIVPASLISTPSPSATAVVPLAVPPSIRFISAAVVVTPSKIFNSAAVLVTPSRMLSSAAVEVTAVPFIESASVSKVPSISASPEISNEPASSSPLNVKFRMPV